MTSASERFKAIQEEMLQVSPRERFSQIQQESREQQLEEAKSNIPKAQMGIYGSILEALDQIIPGLNISDTFQEYAGEIPQSGARGLGKSLGFWGDVGNLVNLRKTGEKFGGLPSIFSKLPTSEEIGTFLEEKGLPPSETGLGELAEYLGQQGGTAAQLGGNIPAFLVGGALGELGRQGGLPEPLPSLIELAGTAGSGAWKKKVTPTTKRAQELASKGRHIGLTEEQLSPLVKKKGTFNILSKVARKSGKLEELAGQIDAKLGDSYKFVKEAARKEGSLPMTSNTKLVRNMEDTIKKLSQSKTPSKDKEEAIKILQNAVKSYRNRAPTYESLIDSYQDINKMRPGVRNLLKRPKEEYVNILKNKSSQLGEDFEATNRLYAQFKDRLGKLKPGEWEKALDKMEALGLSSSLLGALFGGNPLYAKALLGEAATRSLANQFLTNPYLQNLSSKFRKAILEDHPKNARAIAVAFKKFIKNNYEIEEEDLEEKGSSLP